MPAMLRPGLGFSAPDRSRVWKETASGAKNERTERKKVLALAQARNIDVILATELTRWGRSMLDLFHTLQDLQALGRLTGRSDRLAVRSA